MRHCKRAAGANQGAQRHRCSQDLDYFMRLDDDSHIISPISYDIFHVMKVSRSCWLKPNTLLAHSGAPRLCRGIEPSLTAPAAGAGKRVGLCVAICRRLHAAKAAAFELGSRIRWQLRAVGAVQDGGALLHGSARGGWAACRAAHSTEPAAASPTLGSPARVVGRARPWTCPLAPSRRRSATEPIPPGWQT